MDLARVGLFVDSSGAIRSLNVFTGSAHNAGRAGNQLEVTARRLTGVFRTLSGYFAVRQLVEYADAWQLIAARVNLVSGDAQRNMTIQQRLFDIAQKTRNSMAATAVLYTRVALNADQLGRSHNELLTMVESVNSAMLISGATGVEAAQGMRQLAQALGSGRLQGDEFRTVMEAMPAVARAIADEMGVAVGQLYKLSKEGKISVQVVIDALINANKRLTEQAANIPMTFSQSMTYFVNSAERMFGILNQASGVTGTLSRVMKAAGDNMDKIVAGLIGATAAIVAYRLALLAAFAVQGLMTAAKSVAAFLSLARSVRSVADAMALLSLVGKGALGAIAVVAAATVGFVGYKKILAEINEETEKWIKAQGDLDAKMGEYTPPVDEDYVKLLQKTRHEIEDMLRLAQQEVILAGTQERTQKRLQIVMDAVNKRVEARRELTGSLLREMLAAIDAERDLLLKAEDIEAGLDAVNQKLKEQAEIYERFAENLQRSFGDVFFDIMNDGISRFSDLFKAIKAMFLRMLAEMLAAQMMQKFGTRFAGILAGLFGGVSPVAAAGLGAGVPSAEELERMAAANGPVPVKLEAITASASRSMFADLIKYAGPALAGFGVGSAIGGMTTNRKLGTIGGALGGAATGALVGSVIPGLGTIVGGIVGGLAGAIGGFLTSNKNHQEELRKHREVLMNNNRQLEQMRRAFEGNSFGQRLSEVMKLPSILSRLILDLPGFAIPSWGSLSPVEKKKLQDIAAELNIQLLDEKGKYVVGSLEQLARAVELASKMLTQFGNNLQDAQLKQEAYNKLFDIADTPQQRSEDTYAILRQLAPDLLKHLGLDNLNLASQAGRAALEEGLRSIFTLITSGQLTPELLGAFADKGQLIDVILRVKDALNDFHKELFNVTTDFPRAMDIIYYEQKFGRYGVGYKPPHIPDNPPGTNPINQIQISGGVHITNESGDSGEVVLGKIEHAIQQRRARGGFVMLGEEIN